MELKSVLGIDPVLVTGVATAFIGVCGALGVKELLAKMYDRYCKKEDEKDSDHKELLEMKASIDEIIRRLDEMERKNDEFTTNDMLLLEDRLLWMQRKAIQCGMVSRGCMPRYKVLLKRYKDLNAKTDIDLNEEIAFNDVQINKLISDGNVVDTWEDTLK